jgi:hypothetical protein
MRPEVVGSLVEGAIPFFGGIYATLLAYRVLGKKPGESPRYDEWHAKSARTLKVLGPLVALFGVYLAVKGILQAR